MPTEASLLAAKAELNAQNIFPRRYFYPSLDRLPYVSPSGDPVVTDACTRVLCLPLHPTLPHDVAREVCDVLIRHAS
jgi:dTDP-4-amino-4,6-dideoxygalactose transaminase